MNAQEQVFQDIEVVNDRTLKFRISPTNVTYANTLRRAVQTEVETLGFRAEMTESGSTTDVKIFKNSTPMSNEMLADRIGLIPIAMPAGKLSEWDPNSVLFRLHVKNETDSIRYVTASDFECLEIAEGSEERKMIPNTQFFYPDPVTQDTCLIAILKPMVEGQEPEEIHLEAYASLGRGREHTRFNPTSQCSYAYTRDETPARVQEMWLTWLREQKKVDPKELEKDSSRKSSLEKEFRSLEIYRCYKVDANGEPNSFDFTIETLGTMSPAQIIYNACVATASLVEKYSSLDTGELPMNVEIRPADSRVKGFDFWFTGEDHTLGNLLTTYLDEKKVGRGAIEGGVTFAAYKVPHPLRDEMVLRIGVEDGKEETARQAIAGAAKGCAIEFWSWAVNWIAALKEAGPVSQTLWEAHAEAKSAEVAAPAAATQSQQLPKGRRTMKK